MDAQEASVCWPDGCLCFCVSLCCSGFRSDENIYKGPINVVAMVDEPGNYAGHIAFDVQSGLKP